MFLQNISKFISNYRYEQASKETLNVVKAAFIDFFESHIEVQMRNHPE